MYTFCCVAIMRDHGGGGLAMPRVEELYALLELATSGKG